MEEAKQRNKDHIRNKRKYKAKSFKDPRYVPSKSTCNLVSNWERYEEESDIQDCDITSNTDFSILANAPITKGHHFQFKSDKIIAEEIENKIPAELFSLNLNLLRSSILTVPFYNRVGIDIEYFTENQLKFMDRDAEINLMKYNEEYAKETVEKPTEDAKNENKHQISVDDIVSVNEELKQSCVVSEPNESRETKEVQHIQNKSDEDLERWLDDFLDD